MDEAALVEITAELDKESYWHFKRFALLHWKRNLFWLSMCCFDMLVVLCFGWLAFFRSGWWGEGWPGVVVFGFLFFAWAAYALYSVIRLYRPYRELTKKKPLPQTYCFYEDRLLISGGMEHMQGLETIQYDLFNAAAETKYGFYLVFHKRMSYILDKKYISPEQAAALRAFLARKLGEKFRGK